MTFHKTLFFRAFLLFFIVIVACILIISIHLWGFLVTPIAKKSSDKIYRQISILQSSMTFIDKKNHSTYIKQVTSESVIFLRPEKQRPKGTAAKKRYQKLVHKALTKKLSSQSTEIIFGSRQKNGRKIDITWVKTNLADQSYWLGFPRRLPRDLFYNMLFEQVLFIFFITLLLGLLVTYTLKKPLSTLISAADTLSKGIIPPPIKQKGPWEFQQLASAFNKMSNNLKKNANEKALMLAGISHDLRTPLSRIRLGLEILTPKTEKELTDSLIEDVESMDAILGQFLAFADDHDNEPMAIKQLNKMIIDVVSRYKKDSAFIRLNLGRIPEIKLREVSIKRLLSNLIDNGLQHGGKEITINTQQTGHQIILSVKDKGKGIPCEDLETVKQPFKRLQDTQDNTGGAGLGLSIVDKIALSHNAHFELLANANKGLEARLTFTLEEGITIASGTDATSQKALEIKN